MTHSTLPHPHVVPKPPLLQTLGVPPRGVLLGGGSQNHRGLLLVKKDDLHVDIVPVLVQKVLQEVGDALKSDVSTDHNVPEWERPVRGGGPGPRAQQDRGSAAAGKHHLPPRPPRKPSSPPRGLRAKRRCWQVLSDSSTRKAYGFSPDAARNPIKSPTVWPSGFMHLTISDIMLALKCCIIKSLADSYLSLSAHKAPSREIY